MSKRKGFFKDLFGDESNDKDDGEDDNVSVKTLLIVFVVGLVIIGGLYMYNSVNSRGEDDEFFDEPVDGAFDENPFFEYEAPKVYNFSMYNGVVLEALNKCVLQPESNVMCFKDKAIEFLDENICFYIDVIRIRTNCLNEVALKGQDVSVCELLTDNVIIKASCIVAIHESLGDDISFCDEYDFSDEVMAMRCFRTFAKARENPDLCDLIRDKYSENEVFHTYLNSCYFHVAQVTLDISVCDRIDRINTLYETMFNTCVSDIESLVVLE